MERLFTLAYPELEREDAERWAAFRAAHSPAARFDVAPHFTLAFGCAEVPRADYEAHVARVAASTPPVSFVCRYAMLGADDEDDRAYVFLVPDEGFAAISRLHDELYTGPLAPHLRLDLPYVPHITIGVLSDRQQAKDLCDQLNAQGVCVAGALRGLTVGAVVDGTVVTRSTHDLGACA